MGVFRAALTFIIGTFFISVLDKYLDKLKEIPLLGDLFGDKMIKYVKDNQAMTLVLFFSLLHFII